MNIKKGLGSVALVLAILLICFLGMQALIYYIGYSMDADSVECDWWQCTFKKTLKEIYCYHNGEQVPCPEIDMYEEYILETKRQNEP